MPIESNGSENFKMIQNPGFLPHQPRNWITSSLCHSRHTLKISERSVHNFLSYLANTQTNRQTESGKNITSLAEVITELRRDRYMELYIVEQQGSLCSSHEPTDKETGHTNQGWKDVLKSATRCYIKCTNCCLFTLQAQRRRLHSSRCFTTVNIHHEWWIKTSPGPYPGIETAVWLIYCITASLIVVTLLSTVFNVIIRAGTD